MSGSDSSGGDVSDSSLFRQVGAVVATRQQARQELVAASKERKRKRRTKGVALADKEKVASVARKAVDVFGNPRPRSDSDKDDDDDDEEEEEENMSSRSRRKLKRKRSREQKKEEKSKFKFNPSVRYFVQSRYAYPLRKNQDNEVKSKDEQKEQQKVQQETREQSKLDLPAAAAADVYHPAIRSTQDLFDVTWKTHRCSPLYQFNCRTKTSRTMYQTELQKHFQKMFPSEELKAFMYLVNTHSTSNAMCCFDVYSATAEAVVFQAVFYRTKNVDDVDSGFTTFPVLFLHGNPTYCLCFSGWCTARFDCYYNRFVLPSHLLQSFLYRCVLPPSPKVRARQKKRKNLPLMIEYEFPSSVKDINTMTLTFPNKDVEKLVESIPDNVAGDDERRSFMIHGIQQHVLRHFALDVRSAHLRCVGSSHGLVHADGRLKVYTRELLDTFLGYTQQQQEDERGQDALGGGDE